MKNVDILNLIFYICNKEQSANVLSPEQFNLLFPILQRRYIDNILSDYERGKKISLTIQQLRYLVNLNIDSDGNANLPNDYIWWDGCQYPQVINSITHYRPIGELTSQEYVVRMDSTITMPTEKAPIALIRGTEIQFEPLRSTSVKFQYIREPVEPYLDYYIDDNSNIVYMDEGAAGGTVINGDVYVQIASLILNGITTENSNNYYLYWDFIYNISTSLFDFSIYKDTSKLNLVAKGSAASSGAMTINQQNTSGITGTCTITPQTYYTLAGDANNIISASSITNIRIPTQYYWEVVCTVTSAGVITSGYNIYTDVNKINKIAYLTGSGANFNGTLTSSTLVGSATIINAYKSDITVVTDNKLVLSNFVLNNTVYGNSAFEIDTSTSLTTGQKVITIKSGSTTIASHTGIDEWGIIPFAESGGSGYSGYLTIDPTIVGDTNSQFSSVRLTGVRSGNSDSGKIYYQISHSGSDYWVYLFKDLVNSPVAYALTTINGIATITLPGGSGAIGGYVIVNTSININRDAGNYFDFSSGVGVATVDYRNGDWDISNTINIIADTDDENTITSYGESVTVECELRDDDKINIAGMMLESVGMNINNENLLKYAQQFKSIQK